MRDFDLEFTESRSLGATWALDVLWSRLGIGETMRRVLADRNLDESAERVLFALVAKPGPGAFAQAWLPAGSARTSPSAAFPPPAMTPAARRWTGCLEIKDALETEVLERVTYVPNQEVDLLVFDAASRLETDQPQVVGVAVTRHGIPVRAWSWSGRYLRLGAGPAGT